MCPLPSLPFSFTSPLLFLFFLLLSHASLSFPLLFLFLPFLLPSPPSCLHLTFSSFFSSDSLFLCPLSSPLLSHFVRLRVSYLLPPLLLHPLPSSLLLVVFAFLLSLLPLPFHALYSHFPTLPPLPSSISSSCIFFPSSSWPQEALRHLATAVRSSIKPEGWRKGMIIVRVTIAPLPLLLCSSSSSSSPPFSTSC